MTWTWIERARKKIKKSFEPNKKKKNLAQEKKSRSRKKISLRKIILGFLPLPPPLGLIGPHEGQGEGKGGQGKILARPRTKVGHKIQFFFSKVLQEHSNKRGSRVLKYNNNNNNNNDERGRELER